MFKVFKNHSFYGFRELVHKPNMVMNMSIDIQARPSDVFFFLERLGGKNGWYSYDSYKMLRNWFAPENIQLSNYNQPFARRSKIDFMHVLDVVRDVRINLLIKDLSGIGDASMYLLPNDDGTTKFISLVQMRYKNFFWKYIYGSVLFAGDFILRRKILMNIKKLAELKYQGKMKG
jgi:hypothetical protein